METVEGTETLTLKEVAAMLRVSTRSVRNWVHAGKLRAWKTPGGAKWRVDRAEIERLRE